jgi:predicted oxidoreductase
MIHRPDPFMDAAETGAALDNLVDSGKVKAIGVSNFSAPDWRLLQKHMQHKIQLNQIEISLLASQCFSDGALADMQLDDIQPMAWSPLAGGALFSNSPAANRIKPLFKALTDRYNCSADHIAIAWLLAHPANIIPVLGTNNLDRIKGLSNACDIKLDRETWYLLYSAANGCEVP